MTDTALKYFLLGLNQPIEGDAPTETDISVTLEADVTTFNEGAAIEWTITVTNEGAATGTGIMVTDDLHTILTGETFDDATPSQGTYDYNTGVWDVGTINAAGDATLVINVTTGNSSGGTTPTCSASLSGINETDTNAANDSDSVALTINALYNAGVTIVVDNATPLTESDVIYTITVTNTRSHEITGLEITDDLATELADYATYDSHDASDGTYDEETGIWTLGTLAGSASATLDVTYTTLNTAYGQSVTITATITDMTEADTTAGDDTDTVDIDILSAPLALNFANDTFQGDGTTNAIEFDIENLALCSDLDDAIDYGTLAIVTDVSNGTTDIDNGVITYTPDANYTGTDSFTYHVQDAAGNWSNTATITIAVLTSEYQQEALSYSPTILFPLNETSGTTATDVSGTADNGTYTNTESITLNGDTAIDGRPAMLITGNTGHVACTDADVGVLNDTTWTISFWFRIQPGTDVADGTDRNLAAWIGNNANNQLLFRILGASGDLNWLTAQNGNYETFQLSWTPDNNKHHMGMKLNGGSVTYYFDGAAVGSDTGAQTPNSSTNGTLRVGANSNSCTGIALSMFALYPTALADADVATLYTPREYRYTTLRRGGLEAGLEYLSVSIANYGTNDYDDFPTAYKTLAESQPALIIPEIQSAWKYHEQTNNVYWTSLLTPVTTPMNAANIRLFGGAHVHVAPTWFAAAATTPTLAEQYLNEWLVYAYSTFPEIEGWVVANEIMHTSDGVYGDDIEHNEFYTAWDDTHDYIPYVFQRCYEIAPHKEREIRDFFVERAGYWKGDAFYNRIDEWLDAGVPITTVGLQAHFPNPSSQYVSTSGVAAAIVSQVARFKALGLKVRVTELDIIGLSDSNLTNEYYTTIDCFLDAGVDSIAIWGITDQYSWRYPADNALLWTGTTTITKKAAWYAVMARLYGLAQP